MASDDARRQEQAAARSRELWEDLARMARGLHCPDHYVEPWRVNVIGDSPATFRLYISGCCQQLQVVVNEMIANDPRVGGPR